MLILGSGNVVHNLRELDWSKPDLAYDWARRFDDAAREVLLTRPAEAAALERHPEFRRAHPTPDHFLPLLYVAGVAARAGKPMKPLVDGHAFGSISMAACGLDAVCPPGVGQGGSAAMPNPSVVPPHETHV